MGVPGASNTHSPSQPPTCPAPFLQSRGRVQSQAGSIVKTKTWSKNCKAQSLTSSSPGTRSMGQADPALLPLPAESARMDILGGPGLQWELVRPKMWLERPTPHTGSPRHMSVDMHTVSRGYPFHTRTGCLSCQRMHFALLTPK